jgi:hypothetical protein
VGKAVGEKVREPVGAARRLRLVLDLGRNGPMMINRPESEAIRALVDASRNAPEE